MHEDGGWVCVHAIALKTSPLPLLNRLWKSEMPCRCGCHPQHHRQRQQQHLLLLSAGMQQEMRVCL